MINEYIPGQYVYIAIAAAVALVALFGFLLYAKVSRGKRDTLDGMGLGLTTTDVKALQEKGLLTPEERARVAAAMARQFRQDLDATKKRAKPRPEELLADPEVVRLEELAEAKKLERAGMVVSESEDGTEPQTRVDDPAPKVTAANAYPEEVVRLLEAGLISVEEAEQIRLRVHERNS